MKILITGATGGIGSAIRDRLKDHDLTCIPRADIHTLEEFDWLICAHGIINEEDAVETFMVNTISNISLSRRIKAKNIIFISSTSGINGNADYPVYSASKAALNSYCKSISKNVNCYALCPGPTDTPLWRGLNIDKPAQSPVEVAKAVELIMNGEYKSGDIITVRDGIII